MDNIKIEVVISKSFSSAYNLSLEEDLLSQVGEDCVLLYLWQNSNSIVIGRNQNPWKECRLDLIKENDVKLIRRLSGGGAVYHDMGNLNFTFIAHKKHYDIKRNFKIILDALKMAEIHGEVNNRNDMILKDKKFSGNAFMNRKDIRMHHGTLLVKSNLDILTRYLTAKKLNIKSKSVQSVKSKVINLSEVNTFLDINTLKQFLIEAFEVEYQSSAIVKSYVEMELKNNKYNTWDWNYGNTPMFTIKLENEFNWGRLVFECKVKNGMILESSFRCNDYLYDLNGIRFKTDEISKKIYDTDLDAHIIVDVIDYMESKNI